MLNILLRAFRNIVYVLIVDEQKKSHAVNYNPRLRDMMGATRGTTQALHTAKLDIAQTEFCTTSELLSFSHY